jgi:hypothetical protein
MYLMLALMKMTETRIVRSDDVEVTGKWLSGLYSPADLEWGNMINIVSHAGNLGPPPNQIQH